MPITSRWDNDEKTVIWHMYDGRWDWPEYHDGVADLKRLLAEACQPVDIVIDMSNFEMPADFVARLDVLDRASREIASQVRFAVLFNVRDFLKAVIRLFKTVYPRGGKYIVVVETLDEARSFIQNNPQVMESLPHP